jgi:hypothetical protein
MSKSGSSASAPGRRIFLRHGAAARRRGPTLSGGQALRRAARGEGAAAAPQPGACHGRGRDAAPAGVAGATAAQPALHVRRERPTPRASVRSSARTAHPPPAPPRPRRRCPSRRAAPRASAARPAAGGAGRARRRGGAGQRRRRGWGA